MGSGGGPATGGGDQWGQPAQYLYGRELSGVQQGGQGYSPLADALGSLRQWTDVAGAGVGLASYDPFGGVLSQPGFTSPWGFAGEYHDPLTGLQYLRARWYQPGVGRFTQGDPFPGVLALPLTQHPYVYGLNSPTRYTDPSGKVVWIPAILGIAALIGGVSNAYSYYLDPSACRTWQGLAAAFVRGALSGAIGSAFFMAITALLPETILAAMFAGAFSGAVSTLLLNIMNGKSGQEIWENVPAGLLVGAVTAGITFGLFPHPTGNVRLSWTQGWGFPWNHAHVGMKSINMGFAEVVQDVSSSVLALMVPSLEMQIMTLSMPESTSKSAQVSVPSMQFEKYNSTNEQPFSELFNSSLPIPKAPLRWVPTPNAQFYWEDRP